MSTRTTRRAHTTIMGMLLIVGLSLVNSCGDSALAFAAPGSSDEPAAAQSIFNGESLAGWTAREAEAKWWRVEDGFLTGGSLEVEVPHNTFLTTDEVFQNFDLTFDIRIQTTGGFANSGFQNRSERVPNSHEIIGYQVDAGDGYWGCFYDESRRGLVSRSARESEILASIEDQEWNSYRILAEGTRIQSWINGIPSTDFTETADNIPLDGHLALQVHGGGKVQVQLRNVKIERLEPTPGVMTWELLHAAEPQTDQAEEPWRSPEEQQALFTLPDGFEIELVASEAHVQKLVEIAFDDAGRMWGLTAAEYPIDANEDPGAAAKYQGNSRDQVVVFDDVWGNPRTKPRIFADGFAMPMAILPEGDGVLLAHGPEILRLFDDDQDGVSDRREVVLDGFGIQDSHLMPHRFVRAPGGWVYVAQGAYNDSTVRTKSGELVTYNKCKIGRFRRDGSAFEIVGIGLNNIWGFVLDRRGDMWIQEANDLGYPLVPFVHGATYPGIGDEKFHRSSPWQPPISTVQMGGTGLSGLAQSGDRSGYPAPWDETFFVANPIMSSVQSLQVETGPRPSDREVQLAEEFVTSADKNFRPVAIHFGPDGCLYIVDWYNPIISHNEVSRDHPDRDKESTRIWRVRHESQSKRRPLDMTSVATAELVEHLDSDSTWVSRAAWHQLVERGDDSVRAPLIEMAGDINRRVEARILALWTLEDAGWLSRDLVASMLSVGDPALVREGARLSAHLGLEPKQLIPMLNPLAKSNAPRVRLAAIASLASQSASDEGVTLTLLSFLRPSLGGPVVKLRNRDETALGGEAGEIALERSLLRIALAQRPGASSALEDSLRELPVETQVFAATTMGGIPGAERTASLLGQLGRKPTQEELELLSEHLQSPVVQAQILEFLNTDLLREEVLRLLMKSNATWDDAAIRSQIVQTLRDMTGAEPSPDSLTLAVDVAKSLGLRDLEDDVVGWMQDGRIDRVQGVAALVELGCQNVGLFVQVAGSSVPGSEARRRAVSALASIQSEPAFGALLELWPSLERGAQKASIAELLAKRGGAQRLLDALSNMTISVDVLDGIAWIRLKGHLGEDKQLRSLQARAAAGRIAGLRLDGGSGDYVDTNINLDGAFTVEAWMNLDPGISNDDSLLALPGVFDLNFYDATPRLWMGDGGGDVITATRRVQADRWFHIALTRSESGELRMYLDGELDQTSNQATPPQFEGLDIGRSSAAGNTKGRIVELRVWDEARTAELIHGNYRHRKSRSSLGLPELLFSSTLDPVVLVGSVTQEPAFDPPPLLTAIESMKEHARFKKFRELGSLSGDLERGAEVFARTCAACHRIDGKGGEIGPGLDGVGAKTLEGILRSTLTPNAGVESGYRNLIVHTYAGELLVGYLAREDDASITLRRVGRDDLRLQRSDIESMRFDQLSLMPEGLLDSLDPKDATDLLTYLQAM